MLLNILRQNAINCVLKRRLTAVGPFSRNKSHLSLSNLFVHKDAKVGSVFFVDVNS